MEKKRSIIGLMGSLLINNILYMFINTFMVAYFYTLTIIKDYLAEHQVVSEISLNVARIIGYTILFVISLFNNIIYFKILLVFVSIIIIYYAILMIKLNKV